MAHAVSLAYTRSDHMSPLAVAMTTALHVSVAAALWWISPLNFIDNTPDPIEVTVEVPPPTPPPETPQPTPVLQPTPPPAAAQPAQPVQPSAPPAPPMRLGLAPSGSSTDPKATPGAQQPSPPQPNASSTEAAKPEPDKTETPQTETPKADPPKVEQRQAAATPPPPPPPPPMPELENALPPLEAPPAPVTSREIPRPAPPPPAPKPPPPPPQHAQPAPPPPPRPPQQQALQSSPLSHLPPPRTNEQQQAARQAPAFVNPADMAGQRRIEDQYLWTVSNRLSQHAQFVRNITTEQGTVVLRLVIARDGRLVDVGISRSSGVPSLDNVSLNMVRQAAPYQPLPDSLSGTTHAFVLPLYFRRNE